MFPDQGVLSPEDLLDYFGPATPPMENPLPSRVTLEIMQTALASTPPLPSPPKDEWRNEHLAEIARDLACGAVLARVFTAIVAGDAAP